MIYKIYFANFYEGMGGEAYMRQKEMREMKRKNEQECQDL
jgi:hypothetical protein